LKAVLEIPLFCAEHHSAIGTPVEIKWASASITPYLLWLDGLVVLFFKPFDYRIFHFIVAVTRFVHVTSRAIQAADGNQPLIWIFWFHVSTRPRER
jgi:hypothetical protein